MTMSDAPLLNPNSSALSGLAPESTDERQAEAPIGPILEVLREGRRFLVSAHTRPDGDAVGSMLAMGQLLEAIGKQADLVSADGVPATYLGLPGADRIRVQQSGFDRYDAVILLECDSLERTRLEGLEGQFLINIDHHLSGRGFGHVNWIDCHAASVGELVYRLIKAAGVALTPAMATCLYTTLLTDTGGFRWGSVTAATFFLAGELVAAGADPVAIAKQVYFSIPMARMKLTNRAFMNLQCEGALAWSWIYDEDVRRAQALEEDCEGIVQMILAIAGIEVAAFVRELPEGGLRLSLRSKGQVNVAALAEQLGGGGHQTASGGTLAGPFEQARDRVLSVLRPAMAAC